MRGKKIEEKKGTVEVLKISTDRIVQGRLPVPVGGATSAIFKRRQIPNRARGPDRRIGVPV